MHVAYFQHLASHRHDDFFQPFVPSLCRAQNRACVCVTDFLQDPMTFFFFRRKTVSINKFFFSGNFVFGAHQQPSPGISLSQF